jgi:hypothetical protein
MASMFGSYKKFSSFIDETPLFNFNCFVDTKDIKEKQFYIEFCQTQNFRHFLQTSQYDDFGFFEEVCTEYKEVNVNRRQSVAKFHPTNDNNIERTYTEGNLTTRANTKNKFPIIHETSLGLKYGHLSQMFSNVNLPLKSEETKMEVFNIYPFFMEMFVKESMIKLDMINLEEYITKRFKYNRHFENKIFLESEILFPESKNIKEIRQYNLLSNDWLETKSNSKIKSLFHSQTLITDEFSKQRTQEDGTKPIVDKSSGK